MPRILLLLLVLLAGLLVLDRATRPAPPPPPVAAAPAGDAAPASAGARPGAAPGEAPATPPGSAPATPAIDRLVTLANRQRLDRERRYTYIDSLLVESDSLIRRWPAREGRALRVHLEEAPGMPGWRRELPSLARRAMMAWQEAYPDLRFEVTLLPDQADIDVRWIERFEIERTGQTDLQFRSTGEIQHGLIVLALQNHLAEPLSDEGLLAVAVHEFGHVLGLPHSGNPADVMYPETRTARISPRDRATLVLLYALAPGSLRLDP